MKRNIVIGLMLWTTSTAGFATAQSVEISILGGWTTPTLEQTVVFDPDISIPGATIQQQGNFQLTAAGTFAFGGSVSFFFNEHVGFEARVDTIDVNIDTSGPRLSTDIDLGSGFPSAEAFVQVSDGVVNVERLFPLSFNVKARTGGRARFVGSGGLSYLPRVRFDAVQPVSLGLSSAGTNVDLASVVLQAGALADDSQSRWGVNGGAGFEVDVSDSVAITGDVRIHSFQTQTFVWQRSASPSTALEEILITELEKLPPIEIQLIYFQVVGGVVFRF